MIDILKSESESTGAFIETQDALPPKKVATTGGKREGAGRPRKNGVGGSKLDVPQAVYLTKEQYRRIKQRADIAGVPVSELLRQVVERYLL